MMCGKCKGFFPLFLLILPGTYRYFSQIAAPQIGMEISFVDLSDLSKLKSAIKPNTKVSFEVLFHPK